MQWILFATAISMALPMTLGFKTLSNVQWSNINNILRITTDEKIQTKTRNVIYEYYESWAIQQSHVFKQYHSYLCRDIRGDELALYGCMGLKKATINYDPTKCGIFTKYADFYVKGELYRGTRKMRPIHDQVISHESHIEKYTKKIEYMTEIVDHSEKWRVLRNELSDFDYRCMSHKYTYEFVKEMSNKKIAEFMACSEEHVRKAIVRGNSVLMQYLQG